MAFILPAWSANKRVKYIGPDGGQIPQEDRRWHWLQAELTKKLVQVACLQHVLLTAVLRVLQSNA